MSYIYTIIVRVWKTKNRRFIITIIIAAILPPYIYMNRFYQYSTSNRLLVFNIKREYGHLTQILTMSSRLQKAQMISRVLQLFEKRKGKQCINNKRRERRGEIIELYLQKEELSNSDYLNAN